MRSRVSLIVANGGFMTSGVCDGGGGGAYSGGGYGGRSEGCGGGAT